MTRKLWAFGLVGAVLLTIVAIPMLVVCGGLLLYFFALSPVAGDLDSWLNQNLVHDHAEVVLYKDDVHGIYLGSDAPLPSSFFVLIGDSPKLISDITEQDLLDIGFEKEWEGFYSYGAPAPTIDSAYFSAAGLERMEIYHHHVQFSASAQGPFLTLPVSYETFKGQFGEPQSSKPGRKNHRQI